jgi:hypothetical protein
LKQSAEAFLAHPSFFGNSETTANTTTSTSSDNALWVRETALTNGLVNTVRSSGAKFLLTSWATPGAGTSTALELAHNLETIAMKDGFPYLNLDSAIANDEAATGESAVWPCDDHWSATGHADAGQAIFNYLKNNPDLITPISRPKNSKQS